MQNEKILINKNCRYLSEYIRLLSSEKEFRKYVKIIDKKC